MGAQTVILRDTTSPEVILREPKFAIVPLSSADAASTKRAVILARAEADRAFSEANRAETAESGAEAAEAGTIAAIAGVTLTSATLTAATRVIMEALDTSVGLPAILLEDDRFGIFDVVTYASLDATDQADADGADNIVHLRSTDDATKAWRRRHNGTLTPGYAGAAGDGITNDTSAFQALANYINAKGGGFVVDLKPGAIYIVGRQDDHSSSPTLVDGTGSGVFRYTAQKIFSLHDCSGFAVRFNGAKLKLAPALKHGSFNADTTPMASANGYTGVGAASAYGVMFYLKNCDHFHVLQPVLEGSSADTIKGGPWGDTGYQVGGTGLQIEDCTHYTFAQPDSYDHLGDAYQIAGACTGPGSPDEHGLFLGPRGAMCGRNSLSFIGGKGIAFINPDFSFAGRSTETGSSDAHLFASAPMAGVDFEAEGAREVHNITFLRPRIVCNQGAGLLNVGGGVSHIALHDPEIVGDVNYSVYSAALIPFFRSYGGRIVGLGLWQGTSGEDIAARFIGPEWTDDPTLSPTGAAYDSGPIIDGSGSTGSLFERARFNLVGDAVAPVGMTDWIFRDTELDQANAASTPIGGFYFEGTNTWNIPTLDLGGQTPNIYSSNHRKWFGRLFINGDEVATESELQSFHGLRRRGFDGSTQHTYRSGAWNDPVDWAANVGGAAVGEIVDNSVPTAGSASGWICKTAPGDTLAKWEPLGIVGLKAATGGIVDFTGSEDLAGVFAKMNAVFALMRGTGGYH